MQKEFARYWPEGSMEHVVAHGAWQRSRGRNPSASYREIRNPRQALDVASADMEIAGTTTEDLRAEMSRERSYSGIDKALYRIAVKHRSAERAHAVAKVRRKQTIIKAAQEGMSLRAIGEVTDLSTGRIHQIIHSQE
ncbi:MAG TPA: hypothetical protein VFK11_04350 [Candidatus Saccharimonadales bacterium]|nr:hypothetical protein [Candidatus Saccharimonadales bacterium]